MKARRLASLSPAGSTPQSVLASARSAGSAAGWFPRAGPIAHAGASFLLQGSSLYFTGFQDFWQVPSEPGQLRKRYKCSCEAVGRGRIQQNGIILKSDFRFL